MAFSSPRVTYPQFRAMPTTIASRLLGTRILYSRNLYSTLRAAGEFLWIGGSQSDPLARYNVNSYITLQLRYSF